jgi:hypothetical protein
MKPDLITLKEHAADSEAGMIVMSKQFDRQPHTDAPLLTLLIRAMKTPETWRLPFPDAVYCSHCGTYQKPAAFPKNRTRGQGMSYWCKSCHAEYSRKWRVEQAATEGREIRSYRRRWDETRAA